MSHHMRLFILKYMQHYNVEQIVSEHYKRVSRFVIKLNWKYLTLKCIGITVY